MIIGDENGLRNQLQEAAPQPADTNIEDLIRRGLRLRRRRTGGLIAGTTAAVAVAVIALVGVAEVNNGNTPAKKATASTSSQTKNVQPSRAHPTTNLAPIDPTCPNYRYDLVVNGQTIDKDAPLSLKGARTVEVQIQPAPGQLAITKGTAQLIPAKTGAGLMASDSTAVIEGTINSKGGITYQIRLTTSAGSALPAGRYMLLMPYTTPCSAEKKAKTVGGEMYISVNLR